MPRCAHCALVATPRLLLCPLYTLKGVLLFGCLYQVVRASASEVALAMQRGQLEELVRRSSNETGGQSDAAALPISVLPQLSTLKTLLVDPPRSGLDATVIEIARRFFRYVIYVSCNPTTMLRDIRALAAEGSDTEMGGRQVQPRVIRFATFDQFPYTSHLECGALLELVPIPSKSSCCESNCNAGAAGLDSRHVTEAEAEPQPEVESSADVIRDRRGRTTLHLAASKGSAEVVGSLLVSDSGSAFVDATDRDGYSALMRACEPGHLEVVEMLLAVGAATDLADKWGRTALHCAALKGRATVAALLLSHSATDPVSLTDLLDKHSRSPLHYAAFSPQGSADVVELLVRARSDLGLRDEYAQTPLDRAVSSGRAVTVAALVAAGADLTTVDKHGRTALHSSVSVRDNLLVVSALLGKSTESVPTPAVMAMVDQRDRNGRTALFVAAAASIAEAVEMLIAEGNADINVPDSFGVSPLSAAAAQGAESVVAALMEARAALDTQDSDGCTALHHAALHDHSRIVAMLLAGGANGALQSINGVAFNTIKSNA